MKFASVKPNHLAVVRDNEFIFIDGVLPQNSSMIDLIARYDEVRSCYLMSGGYDLLVVVEGDSLRDVATFVSEKLATISGVVSTATHFMLKPYKEQGVLMSRERNEERLAVSP